MASGRAIREDGIKVVEHMDEITQQDKELEIQGRVFLFDTLLRTNWLCTLSMNSLQG